MRRKTKSSATAGATNSRELVDRQKRLEAIRRVKAELEEEAR